MISNKTLVTSGLRSQESLFPLILGLGVLWQLVVVVERG